MCFYPENMKSNNFFLIFDNDNHDNQDSENAVKVAILNRIMDAKFWKMLSRGSNHTNNWRCYTLPKIKKRYSVQNAIKYLKINNFIISILT